MSVALDSVVQQRYKSFEVIIVDGGSKDQTVSIAKTYLDKHPFIKIISEPDKGIYDAMNKGIKFSSGEWLYFMGADDYLYDETVLKSVFELEDASQFDIIYGNVISPVLGKYLGEFSASAITRWNICHQAIFYRKKIFEQLGCYNLKYQLWADWEFNLRWFNKKNIRKKYVDIIIACFVPGGFSTEKKIDHDFLSDKQKLLRRYGYKKMSAKHVVMQAIRLIKQNFSGVYKQSNTV